jgi:hypothetical protein
MPICLLACNRQRPVPTPRQQAKNLAKHLLLQIENVATPFGTDSFTHSFIERMLDAKSKDKHLRENACT